MGEKRMASPSKRRTPSQLSASFSDSNIRKTFERNRNTLQSSPSTSQKENMPNSSKKLTTKPRKKAQLFSRDAHEDAHAPPPPAAKQLPGNATGGAPIRRKKKATVPKPFNFSSRRNKFGTPKHIRAQREAKARRAAREANRTRPGTRHTKYF